MLVIQAKGVMSPTWEGQGGSMSGTFFLAPTLRPAPGPRSLPTLPVWPPHPWRSRTTRAPPNPSAAVGAGPCHTDTWAFRFPGPLLQTSASVSLMAPSLWWEGRPGGLEDAAVDPWGCPLPKTLRMLEFCQTVLLPL